MPQRGYSDGQYISVVMIMTSPTRTQQHTVMQTLCLGYQLKVDVKILDLSKIFNLEHMEILPITIDDIKRETRKDVELSQVYRQGWPKSGNQVPVHLKGYYKHRDELYPLGVSG